MLDPRRLWKISMNVCGCWKHEGGIKLAVRESCQEDHFGGTSAILGTPNL